MHCLLAIHAIRTKFIQIIDLLECLLGKMDLNNSYTIDVLSANKPSDFSNTSSMLLSPPLIIRRSGESYKPVMKVLQRLSNV